MRSCWTGAVLLLAASAHSLPAQIPKLAPPRSPCAFDRIMCEYNGVINVTSEGDGSKEVIAASIVRGIVDCVVRYTDENGTRSASGPGLLEIALGLVPDSTDDLPPGATLNSRLYTVRIACPNAAYDPPHEARWSHPYDTYKRTGGEVGSDARGQAVPPLVLEGAYNLSEPGSTGRLQMLWRLCRECVAPPRPSLPPSPG